VNYAVVLVVRYFGGILLGTGGLTRAYGGAASAALQAAPRRLVVATVNAAVSFAFSDSGAVYAVLDSCGAERMQELYSPTAPCWTRRWRMPPRDACALTSSRHSHEAAYRFSASAPSIVMHHPKMLSVISAGPGSLSKARLKTYFSVSRIPSRLYSSHGPPNA